ncbi:CPBP family intramembrane glutamic endopeptidase [Runella slithyformis]|uniref:Abortive infection protein n=1 Tax=Runella slithyformis (strain ATCC 29530 / DSM 19594 / LMG 11500 / NCIMB 11436 / LSU 4) TaxID=761193 RepID=A0A7U4E7S0_RUNSL|nr:CPBP family intramembrane glutamic endopeptidase [Runella slithyformis]AEI50943.1 Abortive infection protein [Runella slithyformis DSM 19594]
MKETSASYPKALVSSAGLTLLLFILFLVTNRNLFPKELMVASPYFLLIYFLLFTVGKPGVQSHWKEQLEGTGEKTIIFPLILVGILYTYLIVHGHTPFQGSAGLFLFYLVFPTLGFVAFKKTALPVTWLDIVFVLLVVIPATSMSFGVGTSLPFNGSGFSNMMRLVVMISAVYGFGYIRNLPDIGFYPTFRWQSLLTALGAWLAFVGLIMVLGFFGHFLQLSGHNILSTEFAYDWVKEFVRIFVGTALFEELFLRGLLQNILSKKITQSGKWPVYWKWGFALFIVLSFATGYFVQLKMAWFPVLITVLIFIPAYFIEKKQTKVHGPYTALAITSIFFGLVHFHSGSLLFVGLASIAGWAYGYTYMKTNNVFYAALVHALVNSSEFLFHI